MQATALHRMFVNTLKKSDLPRVISLYPSFQIFIIAESYHMKRTIKITSGSINHPQLKPYYDSPVRPLNLKVVNDSQNIRQ